MNNTNFGDFLTAYLEALLYANNIEDATYEDIDEESIAVMHAHVLSCYYQMQPILDKIMDDDSGDIGNVYAMAGHCLGLMVLHDFDRDTWGYNSHKLSTIARTYPPIHLDIDVNGIIRIL